MRIIDADKVVFDYSGLAHISPNDFIGIAKYFVDQIEAMPTILPTPNDPLTLAELREMDGEPVWCEIFVKGHTSFYGIIRGDIVAGYSPGNPNPTNLEAGERGGYGLAWLAYRRKPEEGER